MNNNKITKRTAKALGILAENEANYPRSFAVKFYDEPKYAYLFTAVSNQGNGACAGKKAWLCAGSYLARLRKDKLAARGFDRHGRTYYYITKEGEDALKAYQKDKA